MHEYYRKNQKKLLKMMDKMLLPVKDEIEEITGVDGKQFIEEAKKIYIKKYLEEMPYIGGKKNSGTTNLTNACFLVAMYDLGRNYGMTAYQAGEISVHSFEKYFGKFSKWLRSPIQWLARKNLSQKLLKKMIKQRKEFSDKYPYAWESEYREPNEEYTHQLIVHSCGIEKFLRDKDVAEFIPYLCNLDYAMFKEFGLPLCRKNTIACGDKTCDFVFSRDGKIQESWPPQFLNEDNEYK
ncbi:MAG: L-2-amino-thiazoline-4-carboxylic acid hydrolase [Andreesenia angusta]|nr:L-2-amino-thiazoline-4-carboxylic acid hydrolase [Andreesenia angusta]